MELPFDPTTEFGRIRAAVRVTVNGAQLRTTTARRHGRDVIGLNRRFREAAGIGPSDTITVIVEADTEPRTVTPPTELDEALATAPDAAAVYRALSFTHQREYAEWVASAKKPATRARRAGRAIEMLRLGVRQP